MTRDYIGDWGRGLMPGAYSRALATLGALVRTDFTVQQQVSDPATLASLLRLEWDNHRGRLPWGAIDKADWARAKDVIPADAAAQAWQSFCALLPEAPRLEVISQHMDDS